MDMGSGIPVDHKYGAAFEDVLLRRAFLGISLNKFLMALITAHGVLTRHHLAAWCMGCSGLDPAQMLFVASTSDWNARRSLITVDQARSRSAPRRTNSAFKPPLFFLIAQNSRASKDSAVNPSPEV